MAHRLQTLFLTLLLILGLTVFPVFAEEDDGSWDGWNDNGWYDDLPEEETEPDEVIFPDVQPDLWYYKDVMALYDARVIDGFKDGTFQPESTVTTGQALKMILLAAGYGEPERVASHWARGYLNLALDEGILERGEITDLDVTILRSLVAKVAAKALHLERQSAENFFVDTTDDFTQALYEAGIINGYKDGTYLPGRTLTRAELSAIVHRIYTYREDQNTNDEPSGENSDIQLRTTEKCVSLIKELEGFQEKPYWDYQQYSIGYGSACTKDEYPNGITEAQADILLREMLQGFEKKLDKFLQENYITLRDNQYDAMISLTYNIGSGWMKESALATLLKNGTYSNNELASAIGIWCHVKSNGVTSIHDGLVARRISEINVFLYGDYSGKATGFYSVRFEQTEKGDRARDIAFYEAGSAYDPAFEATSDDGEIFLGWYTEDGTLLTDLRATQDLTVTARWESDDAWV